MNRTFKNHTSYLGKGISPTKKVRRYFNLARNVAFNSEYGKIRHGALLIKGGSIINTCYNKDKFCAFGTRFRDPDRGHATIHAELGCILGLDRSVTRGSTVYVARVGKLGNMKISKPCEMCEEVLRHVGVRKVVYTINDKEVGVYKL